MENSNCTRWNTKKVALGAALTGFVFFAFSIQWSFESAAENLAATTSGAGVFAAIAAIVSAVRNAIVFGE